MKYKVNYSPDAEKDLIVIFRWIADQSASQTAERFVMAIYDYCDNLSDFPFRGRACDDLAPGLRFLGFRKRAVIAFTVGVREVTVHGVYCGGRDYESIIMDHFGDGDKDASPSCSSL